MQINVWIPKSLNKEEKKLIHDAPNAHEYGKWITGEPLQENMVESAKAVVDHFGDKIVFINVLRNMSVDCDCVGVAAAQEVYRHSAGERALGLAAEDPATDETLYQFRALRLGEGFAGRVAWGPKFVVIKKGEHGCLLRHPDGIAVLPAYPAAKVVDPTGAGDCFAGGFMRSLALAGASEVI